jgi:hypothetical protein
MLPRTCLFVCSRARVASLALPRVSLSIVSHLSASCQHCIVCSRVFTGWVGQAESLLLLGPKLSAWSLICSLLPQLGTILVACSVESAACGAHKRSVWLRLKPLTSKQCSTRPETLFVGFKAFTCWCPVTSPFAGASGYSHTVACATEAVPFFSDPSGGQHLPSNR